MSYFSDDDSYTFNIESTKRRPPLIDRDESDCSVPSCKDQPRIVVCILTSDCHNKRTKVLTKLFSDDIFIVKPFNLPITKNLPKTDEVDENQSAERYRIVKALKYCRTNYPENSIIIIKDNSVSSSSSDIIAKTCQTIDNLGSYYSYHKNKPKNKFQKWDICYLCVWLDRCDLHQRIKKVEGTTINISETFSPHGLQALMFSVNGRDILLGKKCMRNGKMFPTPIKPLDTELNYQIEEGNLNALCVNPNLFLFDVSTSDSITDLAKMSVCRRPEQRCSDKGSNFPWAIVIGIIILFIIWMVWKYRSNREKMIKTENKNNGTSLFERPSREESSIHELH